MKALCTSCSPCVSHTQGLSYGIASKSCKSDLQKPKFPKESNNDDGIVFKKELWSHQYVMKINCLHAQKNLWDQHKGCVEIIITCQWDHSILTLNYSEVVILNELSFWLNHTALKSLVSNSYCPSISNCYAFLWWSKH